MAIEESEYTEFRTESRAEFRAIRQALESTTSLLQRHQDDLISLTAVVRKNSEDILKQSHTTEMSNKDLHDELQKAISAEQKERDVMLAEIRGMMRTIKWFGGFIGFIATVMTIAVMAQSFGG